MCVALVYIIETFSSIMELQIKNILDVSDKSYISRINRKIISLSHM